MGLKKYVEETTEEELEESVEETASSEETTVDSAEEVEEIIEEEVEETPTDREEAIKKNINEERANYNNYFKKQKKINTICTVCFLALMVGGFAMVLLNEKMAGVGIYVGIAVLLGALIATFVTSKIFKNKLSEKAQNYVKNLYEITNAYVFDDERIDEIENIANQQLKLEAFTSAHLYKNIKAVRNRNYVTMRFNKKELICCDLAASILVKNRTSPMFLGKMYLFESNYKNENGVILYQLKGGELSRPLDDITDLKLVDGNKKYSIYTNDENYKNILTPQIVSILNSFKIDSKLIDVILSITPNSILLGIDYSDEFMSIPVEKEFNIKDTIRVKKDFEKVKKVLELLNK